MELSVERWGGVVPGSRSTLFAAQRSVRGRQGRRHSMETWRPVVHCVDSTDRGEGSDALAESEARCRTLIEHAPEAIVVFDVDEKRFVAANENACRLFGMPVAELLQRNPAALSAPVQLDGTPSDVAAEVFLEAALAGGVPCFEWLHRNVQGADIRCEVRLVRLPAAGRRLVRGSIIDVTERRRMEEHLREWQKMDALGHLAAGIAHDFNNVLAIIMASAQMVIESSGPDSDASENANAILEAAGRGSALTAQLLSFARRQPARVHDVDLNRVVRDIVSMARRVIASGIQLRLRLDAECGSVRMSRSQLDQILMNLLLNARDAMPTGQGTITVDTSCEEGKLRVSVADTGSGMSEETRQRIFEPFFTTKSHRGGTGLGLSTVYSIVMDVGGAIDVKSRLGQGTTFELQFPASAPVPGDTSA